MKEIFLQNVDDIYCIFFQSKKAVEAIHDIQIKIGRKHLPYKSVCILIEFGLSIPQITEIFFRWSCFC